MTPLQKRFALFLGGCIPVRLALVIIAMKLPQRYLPIMGLVALLPAIGFIYLYLTGGRKVGMETQGMPIWWSEFRIIHGLFYLSFAIYALNQLTDAYQFLLADVAVGLLLFIGHHYSAGSFSHLV
jgi:hypothetical protein